MTRRLLLPAVLLLALALTIHPGPTPAHAVPVPDSATSITVVGEGYGHGHGMSQYGAREAARRGLGHRRILGHYYPGTRMGSARGRMKVLLTADRDNRLVVVNRSHLVAKRVGASRRWQLDQLSSRAARTAGRWRVTPVSGNRSKLSYRKHGRWRKLAVVRGTIEFSAGGRPVELVTDAGTTAYRGRLRSAQPRRGSYTRDTVNIVTLETYLKGVVPREMPALWAPAAVRAQAVAARSYAVYERRHDSHGYFHVYDTTADQVYGGWEAQHPAASRAIRATRRQIRTYRGSVAFTQFSSSNGGWMLAGSRPYLVSKEDPYDPVLGWSKRIPISAIEARWPSAGTIERIGVRTYPDAGTWVRTVVIHGEKATYRISGSAFRSWAGLRAASFRFRA